MKNNIITYLTFFVLPISFYLIDVLIQQRTKEKNSKAAMKIKAVFRVIIFVFLIEISSFVSIIMSQQVVFKTLETFNVFLIGSFSAILSLLFIYWFREQVLEEIADTTEYKDDNITKKKTDRKNEPTTK